MIETVSAELDENRKSELVDVLGEDDFNELLASYYEDVDVLLNDLNAALKSGDPKLIDRALHSIKGAAANVGFSSIARFADDMRHKPPVQSKIMTLISLIESQKINKAA